MAVRNFYLLADIDGRATMLGGGPAAKIGGMDIDITQRRDGGIMIAFKIRCYEENGMLHTDVYDSFGKLVADCVSNR